MDLVARCHSTIGHAPFQNHWLTLTGQMHFAIKHQTIAPFLGATKCILTYLNTSLLYQNLSANLDSLHVIRSLVKLTSKTAQFFIPWPPLLLKLNLARDVC